jgi:hypothetical protein
LHTGNTTSTITWDWDDGAGATGYKVYRVSDNVELADVGTSNWTQPSLNTNTQYSVYVRAYSAHGEGASSANASAYTSIENVTGATFGTITSSAIQLLGSGTISNLTSGSSGIYFREEVTSTSSGWLTTNSWARDSISANTQYHFYITTRNGDGEVNTEQGAYDKYTLTNPPADVATQDGWAPAPIDNYTSISWNQASVSAVRIYCLNTSSDIYSGFVTSYVHSSLPVSTIYTYRLYGRNGDNVENPTYVEVSDTTPPPPPGTLATVDLIDTVFVLT